RHARHLAKIQTFWKLRIVRHRIERNLGSALLGESWSSKQYQNCGQESFHSDLPGSFGLSAVRSYEFAAGARNGACIANPCSQRRASRDWRTHISFGISIKSSSSSLSWHAAE